MESIGENTICTQELSPSFLLKATVEMLKVMYYSVIGTYTNYKSVSRKCCYAYGIPYLDSGSLMLLNQKRLIKICKFLKEIRNIVSMSQDKFDLNI